MAVSTSRGLVCPLTPWSFRFQEGSSPERIVQSFRALKFSQVYGAIAYYLENEQMINEYLTEDERELERSVQPLSRPNPELFARLQAACKQMGSKPRADQRMLFLRNTFCTAAIGRHKRRVSPANIVNP